MDWAKAIEINQAALARIVAELIAMVEITVNGAVSNLIYRAVLRVLHPAESAVRRLIVIAARGIQVKLPPVRPMPKGRVIAGKGGGRVSFQLFDTRKQFNFGPPRKPFAKSGPRVWTFEPEPPPSPLVPFFLRQPAAIPEPAPAAKPKPDGDARTLRLGRRLAAIKTALDDIPRQAIRMARWIARRERMERPKFKSPLRPGPPPGSRKNAVEDIDLVLKECHALARDALDPDTS